MSLIVWVVSGLFSMIGAYCYAELGTMIRKSGGDYTYIMVRFGPFLAFIRLWVECVLIRPCAQAIVALTFAIYATKSFFPECDPPESAVRLLVAFCISVLTFVNCWKVKWATRVQDVFALAKILALVIIIITGFIQLGKGKIANFSFDDTETDITKIALSFYSGLFAYNGWNSLNFLIEEMKDPVKNLPKAIGISCTVVTLVYVMTNVAFYTSLSVPEVLGSEAVAGSFGSKLYGTYGKWIIPVFVAMSTFGGVNGILLTSSRLFYAGANEEQMPEVLSMIQIQRHTPTPAVLVVALLSVLYLCSSDIISLINYTGFGTWACIGLAVACVPVLRKKHPEWDRPIKVNLIFPLVYILGTVFILIVPMIADPIDTGIGIGITLTALPVYVIFFSCKQKPKIVVDVSTRVTIWCQKLLIVNHVRNDA